MIDINVGHEHYDSVSWLIDQASWYKVAFEDIKDLLVDIPGYKDYGLTEDESTYNYVRVTYAATFTDLLAASVPLVLRAGVLPPARPESPKMYKYEVYFINIWNREQMIHIFAFDEEDAKMVLNRDGYGYADGATLMPRKFLHTKCLG